MANAEQLRILKQGVEVWNKWRDRNTHAYIDLKEADLRGCHLNGANLSEADLRRAKLSAADPSDADIRAATEALKSGFGPQSSEADATIDSIFSVGSGGNLIQAGPYASLIDLFTRTNLGSANLSKAFLSGANLSKAFLGEANLSKANLLGANFFQADLSRTDLSETNLGGANLSGANLMGADLRAAQLVRTSFFRTQIGNTIFGYLDLSKALGLDDVFHRGPSIISGNVFIRSRGKIHEAFLQGCGLSDWEIEMVKLYNPDLSNEERNQALYKVYDLQASQAIQISSLFISYSQTDGTFVDKLETQFNEKGIRFWRDIHEMKAGRLEKQIDRAISHNPIVLLILSTHSLNSDWVEHEVRTARGLEKDMGRDVLCPVALDDSWKSSHWPKRVMEQIMEYNILDFSAWEDDVKFEGMFRKLIDGLELFYKG